MKKQKPTEHKRDFIKILMSMSDTELNDFIKANGKPPKPVIMFRVVKMED